MERRVKGTPCLKVDPSRPRAADIRRAAAVLKNGGILLLPTDTVYGIAADPLNAVAVERIYRLKGREGNRPMACLLGDAKQASRLAGPLNAHFRRLARRHWPGGLTLIAKRLAAAPATLTRGAPGIGMRLPDSAWARALARELGRPVAATSANLSGKPPLVSGRQACLAFGSKLDLLVDGGNCPGGVASSVVDCSRVKPRLLRAGRDVEQLGI